MADEQADPQANGAAPTTDAATPPPPAATAVAEAPTAAPGDAGQEAIDTVANIENQLGDVLANLNNLGVGALGGADGGAAQRPAANIDLLRDVQLNVKIEPGRTRMYIEDILRLGEGSVVELEKLAGDPVDVFVNDRLVARGEVLVLNDNFCVRIGEIVSQD